MPHYAVIAVFSHVVQDTNGRRSTNQPGRSLFFLDSGNEEEEEEEEEEGLSSSPSGLNIFNSTPFFSSHSTSLQVAGSIPDGVIGIFH